MWGKRVILLFFVYFLLLGKVNALGMATDYIPDNTILLARGESILHRINLQNPADGPVKVEFRVHETEIARIVGDENAFILPPKSFDKNIYVNITVPKNAKIGKEFTVSYSLTAIQEQEPGIVGMKPTINGNIKVKVVPQERETFIGNVISALDGIKDSKAKEKEDVDSTEKEPTKERKNNIGVVILLAAAIIFVTVLLFNKSRTLVTTMGMDDEKFLKEVQKDTEAHPDRHFYLHGGGVIKNLHELPRILKNMEEHIFNHHVNEERNDFANWIRHVFKKEKLAKDIENAKDRDEIANRVIKHIIK